MILRQSCRFRKNGFEKIILYGSELWEIYDMKEANKLQIIFYKHILGVRQQTPNIAVHVYGELGKYPLLILAKIRSLNYWLKIRTNDTSL